jgi:hypothetical protein
MTIGPKKRADGQRAPRVSLDIPDIPTAATVVSNLHAPEKDVVGPEHTFAVDHTDDRGTRWSGTFRCHVLTIRERTQVGIVRSRLSLGTSPLLLDPTTIDLLEMQAHLAVALDAKPDWADDFGNLHDPGVLIAVYKEVASHEARFHGTDAGASG